LQFKKIFYNEIDSTSLELERLARESAPEGTVVISETQSAGKGQGTNKWISRPGGLYFSLLLRPPKNLPLLSLMTGVVVAETLKKIISQPFLIKWPNDIIHESGKIAGILIESRYMGNKPDYCIIGCGINVNQPEFSDVTEYKATSLRIISPREFKTKAILDFFLENFQLSYQNYLDQGGITVVESFKPFIYLLDRIIKVKVSDSRVIEGKLSGINEEGGLMLLKPDGITDTIFSGKILAQ
jgi:BirA family biotin operon repressor/biotin-[acetyl-CoA-carboxylase] ligase